MRLLKPCFLVLALATLSLSAAAQTSAYGAVSVANYGYKLPDSNSLYYHADTIGFTGGVTVLFPSTSRWKAGVDARFDGSPGDHGGKAGLASLRIAYVPRRDPLSAYFQFGGGVVSTDRNTTPVEHKSGGVFDFAVGLNVRAGRHVFIRPIEFLGSAGTQVGHATIGAGIGYTFHDRRSYR